MHASYVVPVKLTVNQSIDRNCQTRPPSPRAKRNATPTAPGPEVGRVSSAYLLTKAHRFLFCLLVLTAMPQALHEAK